MTRILVTTTSFQDTPGPHHRLLSETGWEIVTARGPLSEDSLAPLLGEIDAILCGDDALTERVITGARPRLRVISKYGIGVDKIDVETATRLGIPVCYTPGVNHTTVAEHAFALLLALERRLIDEVEITRKGGWKRLTGHEIAGKSIGIVGLGRIGREVTVRARAFGLQVIGCDTYWPEEFAAEHGVTRCTTTAELFQKADIISLHASLNEDTRHIVNSNSITVMQDGVVIINCARGELVDTEAIRAGLASGKVGGYGTDVLDVEPPPDDHPLLSAARCIVTPHIASRTYESVVRQATMSVENLIRALRGETPLAVINAQ